VRAHPGAELVGFSDIVGADRNKPAIRNLELTMELNQAFVLSTVLGTIATSAEHENHRMLPLQIGELPALTGMVGQFIVGKDGSWNDCQIA